jgi:hypothetical protein
VANGTYTFTVKAVDAAGNKNSGVTVTATPSTEGAADTTAPAKVSGLTAATGDGQVTLTWIDPPDGDLASIEITWTPADGPDSGSKTVAKGVKTYTASGLVPGTAYTFTVKAKDAAGNTSGGETKTATPPKPAASVKVNFTGLPQDETINLIVGQSLSWSANDSLTVSVSGFSAYRWVLDGDTASPAGTSSSLTLYAGNLSVKQHELTVFVTSGSAEYAKSVVFTVTL